MPWAEIHRRACEEAAASWHVYSDARQALILGEWSVATNHDAPLDIDDPATARELRRLFLEQLHIFTSAPGLVGSFYWTLRMGSGWDPRPTDNHPDGRQREGTSAWRSARDYPFRVWSFLEMAAAGVATPLNRSVSGGVCTG